MTRAEYWESLWRRFRSKHPGAFSDDALLDWALKEGRVDLPCLNPRAALKRELKRALRAARIRDPQNRRVREMLPMKVKDEDGKVVDVVWDHIHQMSLDYALTTFDQRDIDINKQRQAASRDAQSCLDNNPNVVGHESQFQFDFMLEEREEQIVETVQESGNPPRPR